MLIKLRYHANLNILTVNYRDKQTPDTLTLYRLLKTALCEKYNLKNVVTQLINYTRT